jgi:hypothetical protein
MNPSTAAVLAGGALSRSLYGNVYRDIKTPMKKHTLASQSSG